MFDEDNWMIFALYFRVKTTSGLVDLSTSDPPRIVNNGVYMQIYVIV